MTSITFAHIREQGVEFVAVIAKDAAVDSTQRGSEAIAGLQMRFHRPVVLVGEHNGRWYGRRDIVNFMAQIDPGRIPWRRGTIN